MPVVAVAERLRPCPGSLSSFLRRSASMAWALAALTLVGLGGVLAGPGAGLAGRGVGARVGVLDALGGRGNARPPRRSWAPTGG
ncbi:hypothetical protein SGLAM104S_08244 [Streptomyces glaucescens]